MSVPICERLPLALLADYAIGELPAGDAETLEEHLFSCADCAGRAAELDAIMRGIGSAMRSAEVAGFVTDAVLNRLARDGIRVRTFALWPGAVVPCAVWDEDEVMALRLRGNFAGATEVTLSQRVAGHEVSRITGQVVPDSHGEIIFAEPAARIRELPVVEVEVLLTGHEHGQERLIGSYTLRHGGFLHR